MTARSRAAVVLQALEREQRRVLAERDAAILAAASSRFHAVNFRPTYLILLTSSLVASLYSNTASFTRFWWT